MHLHLCVMVGETGEGKDYRYLLLAGPVTLKHKSVRVGGSSQNEAVVHSRRSLVLRFEPHVHNS